MKYRFVFTGVSCMAVLMVAGCPPVGGVPVAPFDATGYYEGTWSGSTMSGTAKEDAQEVQACPLEFTLTQNVNAPWPQRFGVNGTVKVDYSCLTLPDWVDTPPPGEVNVAGVMDEQGKVGLLTGGCGTGMCVALGLDGPGVDTDSDGYMDSFSGEWQFSLLLAGFTPFTIRGSFQAAEAMYE
ncbi:MAG: hypothetical protein GC168_03260 [Candidatus Hydrogenedens sp.]|nr:hypothetical protein [Candidatus Hydrogenedens sp.]